MIPDETSERLAFIAELADVCRAKGISVCYVDGVELRFGSEPMGESQLDAVDDAAAEEEERRLMYAAGSLPPNLRALRGDDDR